MSAKDLLKERLAGHPEVIFHEESQSIEVQPADDSGFHVALFEEGSRTSVFFDGWHDDFDDPEEAVSCFGFGLSEACRLRVTLRGTTPVRWAVESFQDGHWVRDSVTGLLVFPVWRRKTVVYKQNGWLPAA